MQNGVPTVHDPSCRYGYSVVEMFDGIAPTYDLLNRLLSFGMDRSWRRRAARQLDTHRALQIIDLATGTGDLLIASLRARSNVVRAVGLDLAPNMLEIARVKVRQRGLLERATLSCGDATATCFADGVFDAVTMAFGIRNTPDVGGTLGEMYRILKPGGMAVVLEFSLPSNPVVRWCYRRYLRLGVPLIGSFVSRDKRAYHYLNESIERFASPERLVAGMRSVGFSEVAAIPLTFGVAVIYRGTKDLKGT